jgi:ABC-type polysaccharide/polyol phosphate export permease
VVFTGHPLRLSVLFLPVSILLAAVFTLGVGLFLSNLAVFFYDVVEMVTVALTLLMYMTPVFYPMEIVPPRYLWMVRFNPLRSVLEVFRDPIYFGKVPPWTHLTLASVVAVGALLLGALFFRRTSERIPFYV